MAPPSAELGFIVPRECLWEAHALAAQHRGVCWAAFYPSEPMAPSLVPCDQDSLLTGG
jgi:hypothetical protein